MAPSQGIVSIPVGTQRGGMNALRGYYLVARGLARPQRIRWPERPHAWEGSFEVTTGLRRAWIELFGAESAAREIPFSYYSPLSVRMGHDALRLLGVNFRNILYVHTELEMARPEAPALAVGEVYRFVLELERIASCRRDRAILTLAGTVLDARGEPVMTMRDSMMLKNVSPRDKAAIAFAGGVEAAPSPSERPEPTRLLRDESRSFSLHFPVDVGRRYGELSGDTNFVHTSVYVSRIFGYDRLFAHGMCTANHVLKALAGDAGIAVQSFAIDFKRPVFLDQTVELRVGEERFEVCDVEDVLLASGTYGAFA